MPLPTHANEDQRSLSRQHQDICKELNLDRVAAFESWKMFKTNYDSYLLEGKASHWIGCAVYVASRNTMTQTVGGGGRYLVIGNQINLLKLLKHLNLSFPDFLPKVKQWTHRIDASADLLNKIDSLEANFAVSMVIFNKFQPIFADLFFEPTVNTVKHGRHKKFNRYQTSSTLSRTFEFTWVLFISIKANFSDIQADLVSCFHLLLACCDFVFFNAVAAGRTDLINPKFKFDYEKSNSIIDALCKKQDAIPLEVKTIKEYVWNKNIRLFFEKKVLKGNVADLNGVLEQSCFEYNLRSLNKIYDEYVSSISDIDERVFLGNSMYTDLVTPPKIDVPTADSGRRRKADLSTPLSARRWLPARNLKLNTALLADNSIVNSISQKSSRSWQTLSAMTRDYTAVSPSTHLSTYIDSNQISNVIERCNEMAEIVSKKLTDESATSNWSKNDILVRMELAKKIYYRLLDTIIKAETQRNKTSFDPKVLIMLEMFQKLLFACSVEMMIISCPTTNEYAFPWIVKTLGISSYHFTRILEIVVRTEDILSRDIIKHLKWIEESILERLAWRHNSPLWLYIIESGSVPSCDDVIVNIEKDTVKDDFNKLIDSSKLEMLAGKESLLTLSPGAPLQDKFMSPQRPGIKRKRPGDDEDSLNKRSDGSTDEPSNKLLGLADGEKATKTIPNKENQKPRRKGSVALFFRKFYYLASIRLMDLCNQLELNNEDLKKKIWTFFETSIVNHVTIMADRHLDQMLLCAIYIICRVVGPEQRFTDLMKFYRNQPQADRNVYRKVSLAPLKKIEEYAQQSEEAGKVVKHEENDEENNSETEGDIIKFYNCVYLSAVEEHSRMFSVNNSMNDRLVLSPLPVNKTTPDSRWRVTDKHSVFVRQLNIDMDSPNSRTISYNISQSPRKDLNRINEVVKKAGSASIVMVNKQLNLSDSLSSNNTSHTGDESTSSSSTSAASTTSLPQTLSKKMLMIDLMDPSNKDNSNATSTSINFNRNGNAKQSGFNHHFLVRDEDILDEIDAEDYDTVIYDEEEISRSSTSSGSQLSGAQVDYE